MKEINYKERKKKRKKERKKEYFKVKKKGIRIR